MSDIKTRFPLLARHEGVWDGWYRLYDAQGQKIDEHRSRLLCRFPDTGPYAYHQTNHYRWADGRSEIREFPAHVQGERIVFAGDLIEGWAADVTLDDKHRTTMLHWRRKGDPAGIYLYEMIQLSDDGRSRSRVWQSFREGRLLQRTLIDEERVGHDWRAVPLPSWPGEPLPG
jgi:hypothetical protein